MPRGKKAKQPASEEVKKEEPKSEDVKEESPKTEQEEPKTDQEEPKTEQEGSSGDVKKEEKAGFRIRIAIGSGFNQVIGSRSVFGIRI